jgi:hypothetical protein
MKSDRTIREGHIKYQIEHIKFDLCYLLFDFCYLLRFRAFFLLAGFATLVLVSGCSVLKFALGTSERNSYYPLSVGDAWEYRLVTTFNRGQRWDTTTLGTYRHRVIRAVNLADGKPALMRVWESQVTLRDTALPESTFAEAETTYYRRMKNAVYRYLTLQDSPDSILLLPIEIDQRWKSKDVDYWVAAREDVVIDGKSYQDCWCIQSRPTNDLFPLRVWFTKGVGLVRMISERELSGKRMKTDYYLVRAEIKD